MNRRQKVGRVGPWTKSLKRLLSVVATESYNLRFSGKAASGIGKGVKWEGAVIAQELYDSDSFNTRFIPVVFSGDDAKHVPLPLRGATIYDLSNKDGYPELLRRLTAPPKMVDDLISPARFEKELAEATAYFDAKLGSWPEASFSGEDLLPRLQQLVEQVKGNAEYREKFRHIWATLYRMTGGAYLLHSKLEMGDKLRATLPHLRQSLEIWPGQRGLAANIAFLEAFLAKSGGDIREYLTNVLQILRGPDNDKIPGLVEAMAGAASSPERRAQQWLLHEATANPIWNFLEAVKAMLKNERNIQAEIDVTSRMIADGQAEVQVAVGPNVFLWRVNLDQKTYEANNDLTRDFNQLILRANA